MRNEKDEKASCGSKYSVVTYLVIFFVLVIALVLLSYFVEGRRSSSSYARLRTEYQQSLEQHGGRIDELSAALDAEREKAAALEQAAADSSAEAASLRDRVQASETRVSELEKEIETLRGELSALQETVQELENREEE